MKVLKVRIVLIVSTTDSKTKYLIDILIVDKKGDLNVYKQVFSFDDKKTLGCQSKCTQQDDTQLVDELSEETDKIDFNEWAGMFLTIALNLLLNS